MKSGECKLLWPFILAAVFFLIPVGLFFAYPVGFWSSTDNEPLGLANALNLAYRLADIRMYPAIGLTNHPGVQFYLMSWLALALSGHPVAGAAQEHFFFDVINHVEDYHRAIVFVAAFVGATGVYLFARTALKLIPAGATVVALLIWLASTPATILFFMSSGFESVAILINALFFAVLVQLAFGREIDLAVVIIAGCVGAFAYLNKLSYMYIPLALVFAILSKAVFCRTSWLRGAALIGLFLCAFALAILAIGYLIIGWDEFEFLLKFHQNVILGSGLYGYGDQTVVDPQGVRRAIVSIPGDKTYALPLALIAGGTLFITGLVTGFTDKQKVGVAVMGIGAGLAALFSALAVVKHYESHYTAGVSAALPACVVAGCLFARTWNSKVHVASVAITWLAILLMAGPVLLKVRGVLASQSESTRLASEDIREIRAQTAGMKQLVEFSYRVPFREYGEGFIVYYAGVPRLTQEYLGDKGAVISSLTEHLVTDDVAAYVIDKYYFPDVEAVKRAPQLNLLGQKPARFNADDKLIQLRTVFLLIRK